MSTFAEIKVSIRSNLDDAGVTFYSDTDLDDAVQDAYNVIAARTGCIIKRESAIAFVANQNYYKLRDTISDFLGCLAIFNVTSNMWLQDDTSLKDFDKIRQDWEIWTGTTRYWASVNFEYIAMCPKYAAAGSTFDLIYSASAPDVVNSATPLIAADMQDLIEDYATADLLEQGEEFKKAQIYWFGDETTEGFYSRLEAYRMRVELFCKSDLLFKI